MCKLGIGCKDAASVAAQQALSKLHKQCQSGDGVACEALSERLLEKGCRVSDKLPACQSIGVPVVASMSTTPCRSFPPTYVKKPPA